MSFDHILLLHGKGGSPEGSVKDIEALLRDHYRQRPASSFQRPALLHADGEILAEQSLAELQTRDIPKNAVVIGVSLGGLLAAKLQEQNRQDLRVLCLNSPTWADAVQLERRMPERIAFYSSDDDGNRWTHRALAQIGDRLRSPVAHARHQCARAGVDAADYRLSGRPEHRPRNRAGRRADCAGRKAPARQGRSILKQVTTRA